MQLTFNYERPHWDKISSFIAKTFEFFTSPVVKCKLGPKHKELNVSYARTTTCNLQGSKHQHVILELFYRS